MVPTVPIHSLNLESNTHGHKFAVKTKLTRTSIRPIFFSFRIANLWNSLPEHVVEAPSTDLFKNI